MKKKIAKVSRIFPLNAILKESYFKSCSIMDYLVFLSEDAQVPGTAGESPYFVSSERDLGSTSNNYSIRNQTGMNI